MRGFVKNKMSSIPESGLTWIKIYKYFRIMAIITFAIYTVVGSLIGAIGTCATGGGCKELGAATGGVLLSADQNVNTFVNKLIENKYNDNDYTTFLRSQILANIIIIILWWLVMYKLVSLITGSEAQDSLGIKTMKIGSALFLVILIGFLWSWLYLQTPQNPIAGIINLVTHFKIMYATGWSYSGIM